MSATESKASAQKGKGTKKTAAEKTVEVALENAERTTAALRTLVRTQLNARRKKKHTPEQLRRLADGIASVGILQNLIVFVMPNGQFGVAAGEGRLGAMEILLDEKRISSDYAVPILIVPEKVAKLVSLMENSQRENMHPYDQIAAFGDLCADGKTAQEIGAFMGFSTTHVQKMLKLAAMHPQLLEELAEDSIDIDQLQALASTDDTERQIQVWKNSEHGYNARLPQHLRRAVLREEVPADDNPRLALIGVDAYEAAGGTIRHDLFSESGFLSDAVLLDTLALDALNNAAKEAAKRDGWKWGEGRFGEVSRWGSDSLKYQLLTQHGSELTDDEEEKQDSLEYEISELDGDLEDITDADEKWEVEKQIADLTAQLNAFNDELAKRSIWTDEQRQQAGVIAYLEAGEIRYQYGVVLREEIPAETSSGTEESENNEEQQSTPQEPAKKELSAKLICSLSSERTLAVQAALSLRPDVVIATLLHDSIKSVFGEVRWYDRTLGVTVNVNRSTLISNAYDAENSKAVKSLQDMHEKWLSAFPENWKDDFAWLLEWPLEKQLALLAYCMACSVDGVQQASKTGGKVGGTLARIESAIDFRLADWWTPTKSNYFGRMSKDQIADALNDAGLPAFAASAVKMKKGDAAELAENEIAKTAWLPDCLLPETPTFEPEAAENTDTPEAAETAETQPTVPDIAA